MNGESKTQIDKINKCHIKLTTTFCLAWVWPDLLVLLARRSVLHLDRRGYGDEGYPADVLEAFPHGTHMGPDTGICSSVPQSLSSSPQPPWHLILSHLVCSIC